MNESKIDFYELKKMDNLINKMNNQINEAFDNTIKPIIENMVKEICKDYTFINYSYNDIFNYQFEKSWASLPFPISGSGLFKIEKKIINFCSSLPNNECMLFGMPEISLIYKQNFDDQYTLQSFQEGQDYIGNSSGPTILIIFKYVKEIIFSNKSYQKQEMINFINKYDKIKVFV